MVLPIGAMPTPMPQRAHGRKNGHKAKSESVFKGCYRSGPIGAAPDAWRPITYTIHNDSPKWKPKDLSGYSSVKKGNTIDSRKEQDSSATSGDVFLEKSARREIIQKIEKPFAPLESPICATNLEMLQRADHKISQRAERPEPLHSTVSSRSTSPGCGSNPESHASPTVSPTSACADPPHDFFRFEPMYIPVTSAWILNGQYQPDLQFSEDPVVIQLPRYTTNRY